MSKAPLKICDATENASGSRTQSAEENFSRKERKVRKEMEGGNGATIGSGITQFANGEPKRWNYDTVRVYQPLEGGNGVRKANVVTLCSKCVYQIDEAENLLRM